MSMLSFVVVKFFIIFWICLIGFWLINRFIAFPLYRKHDDWYDRWSKFYNHFDAYFISATVASVIAGGIMLILTCVGIGALIETRANEPVIYESYKVEYNTLTDILENSTDVVNSDVYLRVNEYNKEITTLKERSVNSNWKINFTGDYDWNEIPLINLGGKS